MDNNKLSKRVYDFMKLNHPDREWVVIVLDSMKLPSEQQNKADYFSYFVSDTDFPQ